MLNGRHRLIIACVEVAIIIYNLSCLIAQIYTTTNYYMDVSYICLTCLKAVFSKPPCMHNWSTLHVDKITEPQPLMWSPYAIGSIPTRLGQVSYLGICFISVWRRSFLMRRCSNLSCLVCFCCCLTLIFRACLWLYNDSLVKTLGGSLFFLNWQSSYTCEAGHVHYLYTAETCNNIVSPGLSEATRGKRRPALVLFVEPIFSFLLPQPWRLWILQLARRQSRLWKPRIAHQWFSVVSPRALTA
jgi:hypothetical protein